MSDGVAILNDVSTLRSVNNEHLVSCGSVLVESYRLAVHFHDIPFFHCVKANHY